MVVTAQNPLERLEGLLVSHVMTRDVATIPSSATMDEAAVMLRDRQISGAPVVDLAGRCIGVLSAVDFLRFDQAGQKSGLAGPPGQVPSGCHGLPWDSVQRYMTSPVHNVSPAAPLTQAADLMCVQHIHRLIVLDDQEAPVGLVSTLDVISALSFALDEDRQNRRSGQQRSKA